MANNEGNPSEQAAGGRSRDREDREREGRDRERDGRDGRYRFFIHPEDPGYPFSLQNTGYTPQMTAAQHEYRLRNMEIDQLRNELQTCKRRIQDLERQTEGQQRERSSRTGRFMQHWDPYDDRGGDYPRYPGIYPGEDERGYPYSRNQRYAYQGQRGWYDDEPIVHRIDVDLRT